MLTFYNTLTRQREHFTPLDTQCVRMYACGPTVYERPHLGNARSNVVCDGVYRLLSYLYPRVVYVRNFTDIDDKIIQKMQETQESLEDLTQRIIHSFHQDMSHLNVLPPTHSPRATAHIPMMIQMIDTLIQKGFAYTGEGHVWFHTAYDPCYGRFRAASSALDSTEVSHAKKRQAQDFVLWKPSDMQQPGWDSPWGRGRPGWHIECSAMAHHYLGETFDLHAGGQDLAFPHHENEVAQSCAAFGTETLAHTWIHNGLLCLNDKKMAKSLGNTFLVHHMMDKGYTGLSLRWALLSTHYRHPLSWKEELLQSATTCLKKLRLDPTYTFCAQDVDPAVLQALCDDFNTPQALHRLMQLSGPAKDASARLMGFNPLPPLTSTQEKEIETLITQRTTLRQSRDFQRADEIRQHLLHQGILLHDHPEGTTTWSR